MPAHVYFSRTIENQHLILQVQCASAVGIADANAIDI
jgi:hypothetical protein